MAPKRQFEGGVEVHNRLRDAALAIAPRWVALGIGERTIVLDDAFERFPGQIETVELRVASLGRGDGPQSLRIVIEAAEVREACVERALAGMSERRMTQAGTECDGFSQSRLQT